MSWTIETGGASRTLEEIGALSARLSFKTLACDEFSVSCRNPGLSPAGGQISLLFDGVRKFAGRCAEKRTVKSAAGDVYEYTFKSPWQDLCEIPFMQEWAQETPGEGGVKNVMKTRAILGQDRDGEKISSQAQLKEILDFAAAHGAAMEAGEIEAPTEIPSDEMTDMSCAEAVLRVLRWTPDAVSFFDYSSEVPALHIKRRASLPEKSLDGMSMARVAHCAREDMRAESVCVIYEKSNSADGQSWESVEYDTWPEGAAQPGRKTLVFTVPLAGHKSRIQTQKIKTREIRMGNEDWWREKIPSLANPEATTFEIQNPSRKSTLPRELVSGTVMDWMMKSAEEDVITATVAAFDASGKRLSLHNCTLKIVATDASTYNYSRRIFSSFEEKTPKGVAKAVYEAVKDAPVEGSAAAVETDFAGAFCKRVSWMSEFSGAVVTQETLDLFRRTATLKFGPPKHLYPSGIAQLFRTARPRKIPETQTARGSGKGDRTFDTGENLAQNAAFSRLAEVGTIKVENSLEPEKKIIISLDDMEGGEPTEVKLRPVTVVQNGEIAKAYVLMSSPALI